MSDRKIEGYVQYIYVNLCTIKQEEEEEPYLQSQQESVTPSNWVNHT